MVKRIYGFTEHFITKNIGTERVQLEKLYTIIDWLDFGLVALIIYLLVSGSFNPLIEIAIGMTSIIVCTLAFVTSRLMYQQEYIGKGRYIFRLLFWPIWIPIDLIFIGMALVSLVA